MKIIIVGAGIGGLSAGLALAQAGHEVLILESAPVFAEIGAGVQLTPNSTKWFWKWGLAPDILSESVLPSCFNVKSWDSGENLGHVPFKNFTERYGAPYIVIHRADIRRVLRSHAVAAGVKLRMSSTVVKYGFDEGLVVLASGEELRADLVVAADGLNSAARTAFFQPRESLLENTGWAAYRTYAPVKQVSSDPRTAHLVAKHECNCWVGDKALVMAYKVKDSEVFNVVFSHEDNVVTCDWTIDEYRAELRRLFGDWDPALSALLDMIAPDVKNWPIKQVRNLPRWSSSSGKFLLMGDAAHAMAFFLSMGVSMAAEDAAALVECISQSTNRNLGLDKTMLVFEKVRKERAEAVRDATLHAGRILQLPPGPERDIRDELLKVDGGDSAFPLDPNRSSYGIGDHQIRSWCYGHDVLAEVQKAFDGL